MVQKIKEIVIDEQISFLLMSLELTKKQPEPAGMIKTRISLLEKLNFSVKIDTCFTRGCSLLHILIFCLGLTCLWLLHYTVGFGCLFVSIFKN